MGHCDGSNVFVKEALVEMRGARDMASVKAKDFEECTDKCR